MVPGIHGPGNGSARYVGMSNPLSTAKPIRILLVEDSEDILFIMKLELEYLGYTVDVATDAEAALEVSQRLDPDVIVSDIGMPGMNGIEFLQHLRQTRLADIPVVAVSGYPMDDDLKTSLSHGFSAHLTKPVEAAEISAVVQSLLRDKTLK